jgi:CRP-like cAMP-binding protein
MIDRLIQLMDPPAPLGTETETALRELGSWRVQLFGADEHLFRPGDVPDTIYLITAGIACRYAVLPNGRRQIANFLLPGDVFGGRARVGMPFDHNIQSITMLEVLCLERSAVAALNERVPQLTAALWKARLQETAVCQEWLVNVGRRTAVERIGHLFCEIFVRLRRVGLTIDKRCMLPLTQTDIADAVALTPVHVNRTLMHMTRRGWLSFRRGVLQIDDLDRLQDLAGFDPRYLGISERGVQQRHRDKPAHQPNRGRGPMPFPMRLGNDLVADHK